MGLAIVAGILALTILAIYIIGVATRECNNNKDCSENSYCGSDYSCHEYPSQIIVKDYKFLGSSLILGICLIIAAYVYRSGKLPPIKEPIKHTIHEVKELLPKDEGHSSHEHEHH